MKKYRILKLFTAAVYLLFAVGIYFGFTVSADRRNSEYMVEVNRLAEQIEQQNIVDKEVLETLLKQQRYVKQITILNEDVQDAEAIESFYETKNDMSSVIVPLIKEDGQKAYLRFDYQVEKADAYMLFWSEAALLVFFGLVIGILFYLEKKIIRPFIQLKDMPYDFAKGDLTRELKESENRFFGKFLWGIGMLRDSLDYHKNQELKLAKDKKMILLSISHDIKTPLHTINLYAKAIERGIYETEEQKKDAAVHIQKKTEEINDFVKEIIRSATEDVVTIEVVSSEFYLKELVQKIKAAYEEKCSIRKVQFSIGDYADHIVKGDLERIYEAFCNLMENALKYGDGNEIRIAFPIEDNCQLITVCNSGIPVEEDDLVHLFDSFYRGGNAQGKTGNGLGLYICREIMRKCGGDTFAKIEKNGMFFALVLEQ